MSDPYKVQQLNRLLEEIQTDEYALARLKSDGSKTINLDEGALKLLIDYYSGKVTASSRKFTKYPYKPIKATTKRELEFRRAALRDAQMAELDKLGIKPEGFGFLHYLPDDRKEYYYIQQRELACIDMLHSILTYDSYATLEDLMKDEYLKSYIKELGYDKVAELAAGEMEEFKNASINQGVYTDDEGLTYNSVTFKDDVDASTSVKASLVGRNSDRFEIDVYDPEMYDDIMAVIDDRFSSCMGTLFSSFFTIEGPEEDKYDVECILVGFGAFWEEV